MQKYYMYSEQHQEIELNLQKKTQYYKSQCYEETIKVFIAVMLISLKTRYQWMFGLYVPQH